MAKFRILALDGGGIRGLLTTRILKRLSCEPGLSNIFDSIDLIAGTSSGGLVALAMAAGRQRRAPMPVALAKLEQLFENGAQTFGEPKRLVWNLFWSKYADNAREQVFEEEVGNLTLGQLKQKVLIASFDLDNEGTTEGRPDSRKWKPKLFHNLDGEQHDCDIPIWKVATYTTALPVFFPSADGYIDGGVYANNPAMCALAQVFDQRYGPKDKPPLSDIVVLSIGSGQNLHSLPRDAWRWRRYLRWKPSTPDLAPLNWGAIPWGLHIVDLIVDGTGGIADYECGRLLGPQNYRRIAPEFRPGVNIRTDDLEKIAELKDAADNLNLNKDIEWLQAYWIDREAAKLPKQKEKTSKHILTTTELTCMAPIKDGFVSVLDTRSYATRLRIVMKVLNEVRAVARECKSIRTIVDMVDAICSIHSFQFAIVAEKHIFLAVTFAGSWEPYLRIIWRDLGPLMDLILCNCKGYVENSSDKGFERFVGWIRQVQVESNFFYPASGLSVDDHRYLAEVERKIRSSGNSEYIDKEIAELVVSDPAAATREAAAKNPGEAAEQAILLLRILDGLRDVYPEADRDHVFLDRVTLRLLKDTPLRDLIAKKLNANPKEPLERELVWFDKLLNEDDERGRVHGALQKAAASRAVRERGPEDAIQGGILKPYKREVEEGRKIPATHGCLLLARVTNQDDARTFLRNWVKCVSKEPLGRDPDDSEIYTNIAFTFKGLSTLGVSDSVLEMFPKEFREGMEARAGLLGDVRSNHPDRWELPEWNVKPPPADIVREIPRVRISTIDFVVQMRTVAPGAGDDWEQGHPLKEAANRFIEKSEGCGIKVLSRQMMRDHIDETGSSPRVRDHFGFVDGISQPTLGRDRRNDVPLGELLLGYKNARGDREFPQPGAPEARNLAERGSLLDNGTFLVIRKLQQHVDVFKNFVDGHGGVADDVLAKMMGRSRDGAPLADTVGAGRSALNDFDFENDPHGARCPFQAHIRRGNPRAEVNGVTTPRIMRRGMSYGPRAGEGNDPKQERGLMFMAYNASIAEQFEVIQRWMTGGNSTGIFSGQRDPFIGVPDPNESSIFRYQDHKPPMSEQVRRVTLPEQPLVSLKWGMYLFVPSIKALDEILTAKSAAEQAAEKEEETANQLEGVMTGQEIIGRLQTASDWARVFEDSTSVHGGATEAVSAAIRLIHGGARRTPYGVIVASEPLVMQVLRDDSTFSVVEYQKRMASSIGQIYLGLDAGDEYQRLAAGPNEAIQKIRPEVAFHEAWKRTLGALMEIVNRLETRRRHLPMLPEPGRVLFSVEQLADQTLAQLSHHWFDIPDGETVLAGGQARAGDTAPRCPFHTVAASRYIFSSPQPRPAVIDLGQKSGKELLEAVSAFVARHRGRRGRDQLKGELSIALFKTMGHDEDALARNLVGLLEGFLPTVYGNFLKVVYLWQTDERLWRLQQDLRAKGGHADYRQAMSVIDRPLRQAMMKRPIPDLLYRTATKDVSLGDVRVKAGERVVLSLFSATQELLTCPNPDPKKEPIAPVFGGMRSQKDHPTHACPGYEMGMGVLLGMITGLLQAGSLSPAPYPFMQLGDPKPFYDPKSVEAMLPKGVVVQP